MRLTIIFGYFSLFSTIALFSIGIFLRNKLDGRLKLVFYLALASVLSDVSSLILMNSGFGNWPIGNGFLIVQFIMFSLILKKDNELTFFSFSFFACLIFAIINFLFLQGPKSFNSYSAYICGLMMIISALVYLYRLLNEMPVEQIQKLPLFWVAFGVLVYYGGTLFLFLFNNYLLKHLLASHQVIWVLHNVLNITKNAFLFIALWVNYKNKTSPL